MHYELGYWKDKAAGALRHSGELMASAGEKASELAHNAFSQARNIYYPRVATSAAAMSRQARKVYYPQLATSAAALSRRARKAYPVLADSAVTLGGQAKGKLLTLGATARDSIHDTSLMVAGRATRMASAGLWLSGFYLAARLFCPKDSQVRKAQIAIEDHIQTKPVESAFIALGVGYLLGRIFR